MTTLRGLICRLRADTADDTTSDELLRDDINSALCAVQQARPELFATSQIVKLDQGDEQQLDCDCDLLIRIEAVTTKDGRKLANVRNEDPRLRFVAGRLKSCLTASRGNVSYTAAKDSVILNRFTVTPPVNGDVWMRVICSSVDKFLDDMDADASIPCAVYELVLAWAKSQSLSRIVDSASAQSQSAAAMNGFFGMVKQFQGTAYSMRART